MEDEGGEMDVIRLREWEEIVGTFKGIEKDDFSINIILKDFKVAFNSDSTEAKIVEEALVEAIPGEKIAVIRTDILDKPIIVRISKESCPPSLPFISDHRSRNTTKGGSH